MFKIQNIKEMMIQRNFKEYKTKENFIIGVNHLNEYIYIKIFNTKFELNTVREFIWSNFIVESIDNIKMKSCNKKVVQLIIICKSFQNSHVKEFKEISTCIQLIRDDFFNINITKKAPFHQKVDSNFLLNKKELPTIKENDPNCIFYNFIKGDVIRIIRSDGDICYRVVR